MSVLHEGTSNSAQNRRSALKIARYEGSTAFFCYRVELVCSTMVQRRHVPTWSRPGSLQDTERTCVRVG